MHVTLRMAVATIVATAAYLGLAVIGEGGLGPYLSRPPLVALALVTVALALILGGALGNLHDRILYGSVVDFIEVHIFSYHRPDFNVADSAVVTGACLLLLDSLLPKKRLTP